MEVTELEWMVLDAGVLMCLGVLSSKVADRLGVPTLLLFLLLGMLAGAQGIGGIEFDSAELAQTAGSLALVIILFAGGLDTRWSGVRPVLAPGLVLATLGVGLTATVLALFIWFMLDGYANFGVGVSGIGWQEALLLAAIVSSTDAAAVFSVFRTSPVQPEPRLRALLELESGSNDPMAVVLTTSVLALLAGQGGSPGSLLLEVVLALVMGSVLGLLLGGIGAALVNRIQLSSEGLYSVLVLGVGLCAFGLAGPAGGNGFLAAYVAGVVIGNGIDRPKQAMVRPLHDGLSWICQIAMFIMLGLLVYPSQLLPVAGVAVAIALFLMFVARPLSVFLCLAPFRMARREKAYVSWVGLRGSVPIVLATFPASWGLPEAAVIFHLVFFIVLLSMLLQGLTLVASARWLGLAVGADKGQGGA